MPRLLAVVCPPRCLWLFFFIGVVPEGTKEACSLIFPRGELSATPRARLESCEARNTGRHHTSLLRWYRFLAGPGRDGLGWATARGDGRRRVVAGVRLGSSRARLLMPPLV